MSQELETMGAEADDGDGIPGMWVGKGSRKEESLSGNRSAFGIGNV